MASNTSASSAFPQVKRTTSFGQQPHAAALLVDKSKAHIRRSTPDSEALASSDDEQDLQRFAHHPIPRPLRRASWLSETNSVRKSSHGSHGADTMSPSHAWDVGNEATTARNTTPSSTAYSPWGGSIWNDAQRNHPIRLTELKTSEKAIGSQGSEEALVSPSANRRDSSSDAGAIPFAIPLHPTLKTYRSQSYSVGQMEEEAAAANNAATRPIQTAHASRTRGGSNFSALQHRPSRPSMLSGDFSSDSGMLEQVREVADDDDDQGSNISSETGARVSASQTRKMEQIAMENLLRQQQQQQHQQQHAAKAALERSASFSMQTTQPPRFNSTSRSLYSQESVLEENDDDALNETTASQLSDSFHSASGAVDSRRPLEHIKKGHWSSSLGFGSSPDLLPQSRRHSFADVPTRNPSLTATPGTPDGRHAATENQSYNTYVDAYGRTITDSVAKPAHFANTMIPSQHTANFGTEHMQRIPDVASFFSNQTHRSTEALRPASSSTSSIHQSYGGISQSPAPQLYPSMTPNSPLLYLVTFKAARAEFYYVQEGMGLEVNTGDLVIVEADRGTDLGTVAHKNLDWATARELKEKYAAEHYNWLMLFSRQKQTPQTSPPGSSAGRQMSGGASGMRPAPAVASQTEGAEIKPKMIKRLAQPHEIQGLRDKEGNEAKAKRMCHQKVVEHHLAMEILDAEFQMDWKKLTFYYYADAYVNFNNLVTDLFKAYKTRIWMSAVNPDSFVSPMPTGVMGNMAPPPRPRGDRFPDPRAHTENMAGMMYPAEMQQQPYAAWSAANPQEMMPSASMGPSAYSHFFTTNQPVYQGMPMVPPEYARNMHPSANQAAYGQFAAVGRNVAPTGSLYEGQVSNAGAAYPDQLKAFQGLSLGS